METYLFGNLCERDMDVLFLEAIASDYGFAELILEETKLKGRNFKTCSIELSKTDPELGESDITWVIEADNRKYGILIEDKIDAIAMDEQYERYKKRGNKGIANGEYDEYFIFMFSPEKYHKNNNEAQKYKLFVSYEVFLKYLNQKNDVISKIRARKLEQALVKAKSHSNVIINESVNAYFRKYKQYQREHYSELDLRTKEESNGYWAQYATRLGKVYLLHKMQEGYVDLTFSGGAEKYTTYQMLLATLKNCGIQGITVERTGKAASFRIEVPELNMEGKFEETSIQELNECFEAIKRLCAIADIFAEVRSLF